MPSASRSKSSRPKLNLVLVMVEEAEVLLKLGLIYFM